MSVVQLHPEQLLERSADGDLSTAESATLEAHLVRCVACRVLLSARDDFAQERDGWPDETQRALVDGALANCDTKTPATTAKGDDEQLSTQPRAKRGRRAAVVGVVAVLLIGTSAAAAIQLWQPESVTEPVRHHIPKVIDVIDPPRRPALQSTEASASETSAPEANQPQASASVLASAAPSSGISAARLFARATSLRHRGDSSEAVAEFRKLQQLYPSSAEAKASRLIVARLLLDHGDASESLTEYQRHLDSDDTQLVEEALLGRALAYQQLGKTAEERGAWQQLLARYPNTVHKTRAQARLAALP